MDFYKTMQAVQNNVSVTENGMVGYKTTFHPLLDTNFKISSYRHCSDEEIKKDVNTILASEDASYILKFLFMVRDVRSGLGERRLFRVALKEVLKANFENKSEIVTDLIQNQVSKFGRYDDLFIFLGTEYEKVLIDTIHTQLRNDYANMTNGKSISLLAKWMPSENTSSPQTKKLAKTFIKAFGSTSKEYRKLLSALRAYLKVTETYTSANNWGEINYNEVPSKANLKYKDAFLRHDEERRRDYLAALRVGVDKEGKTVKINSSVNFPHDVVTKYMEASGWYSRLGNYDEALEQLWKNLKDKEGLADTIVVRDGSGSMTTRIGSGNTTALDVSTALSIYCAERLRGTFKDKFITFSSQAGLVDLSGDTSLHAKLRTCLNYSDCSNTNIQNVFSLILTTAIEGHIAPEDMPKQVLIISDMEFDGGSGYSRFNSSNNVFKICDEAYRNAGYTLPKLVFWNVNSRSNTIPLTQNENGVILVSGFSVNVLDMVMSGKTDPFEALVDKLMVDTYKEIPLLKMLVGNTTKKKTITDNKGRVKKEVEKPSWL